jgi:HlyD family secretion protein
MKKYIKMVILAIVGLVFLGTFVFLYQKSQPQQLVFETFEATIADLE